MSNLTTIGVPVRTGMELSKDEMYRAIQNRDRSYEGLFIVAVKTTGVFCRPGCPARLPNRENIVFMHSVREALSAGFRPCKKCRPLEPLGESPPWLRPLMQQVEADPIRRWTDADIRAIKIEPSRVRRWFKRHHRLTFHDYVRTRRLAVAMGNISSGKAVAETGLAAGFESLSGFTSAFQKWAGHSPGASQPGCSAVVTNRILTDLGPMVASVVDDRLCLLEFADRRMLETQFKRISRLYRRPLAIGDHDVIDQAAKQIGEYLAGKRTEFELPLAMRGTEFQEAVWRRLLQIPFGQTISYDQLAREIGRRGAQRAVGRANGDNRIAIVIPCHRVVRSDGKLGGYGGKVWRKQRLLQIEKNARQEIL